jgi:uncharacterized membrane protein YecN with MAPEG domain
VKSDVVPFGMATKLGSLLPSVSLIYASVLILIFVALHILAVVVRSRGPAVDDVQSSHSLSRIRFKGNFGPHIFMVLVVMALFEVGGAGTWLLHGPGMAMVGGRLLYASGALAMSDDLKRRLPGLFVLSCFVIVFAIIALTVLSLLIGAIGIEF